MHCLFFNIASHQATFAVVTEESILALKTVEDVVRDDQLPGFIEEVLQEASITFEDLTQITCVIGPGGFTSLRTAVTYANVLADQLDIPLSGIHLADLCSARCKEKDAVWLHSTKRQEIFVRGLTAKADHWSWPDATHLSVEDAFAGITSSAWCGELIEEHIQMAKQKGMQQVEMTSLSDVLPKMMENLHYEKKQLAPWYGRNW
tara:strand:+ start:1577 stop:2188 length:612 start_codon:yes stop_codon:yes gene_type:complete